MPRSRAFVLATLGLPVLGIGGLLWPRPANHEHHDDLRFARAARPWCHASPWTQPAVPR